MARILLIDDDDEVRTVITDMLDAGGHHVLAARDGREGVALYRAHRPELIITDIMMPEANGLEVIMELGKTVKVIALSGWSGPDEAYLRDATAFGAWRTLQKPVALDLLLAAVDEALAT